jgi:Tfp pilus assembly protein PilX
MTSKRKNLNSTRKGVALIIAMLFLAIFGALAVAMTSMSSTNVEAAANQKKAGRALASAESGLEIMRHVMGEVAISGNTNSTEIISAMKTSMQNAMDGFSMAELTTNDSWLTTINVPAITLNAATNQSFTVKVTQISPLVLNMDVTGAAGEITRTVRVKYGLDKRNNSVFDFGVATRGPLLLQGNISVEGVTLASDADVYIESLNNDTALTIIGKSSIEGDVKIVNPDAAPLLGPQAEIAGDKGTAALGHVEIGAPPTEFPEPDPKEFLSYATGTVIQPGDPLPTILTNVVIAPGVNPKFTSDTAINGVLYIQQPNIVEFGGNVDITGFIVCEGDYDTPLANNQLIFRGNVSSLPVTELDAADPQFEDIRTQTGTFCLAPGFSISMGGSFGTLNGAIAANGIEFFGNAGGTIAGSVINYSETPMTLSGNSDIFFNRTGITEIPAGFVPEFILSYDAGSYEEPVF